MYCIYDDNGNPVFYRDGEAYLRKFEALKMISELQKYLETADFKQLQYQEDKFFFDNCYKRYISGGMAIHKNRDKIGTVYFVQRGDGLIKIGCTAHYDQRVKALKSEHGSLEEIYQVLSKNAFVTEFAFHELFEKQRRKGEWFELNESHIQYIKEGKYFKWIQTTIDGNDFDYDLFFDEYYIHLKEVD